MCFIISNNKVKLFYDEMNDYDNSFYHRKHNLHFELIPRNVKNTMNIYFKNLFSNIQKKMIIYLHLMIYYIQVI